MEKEIVNSKEVIQKRRKLPVANQQETKEVIMATDRVVVAEGSYLSDIARIHRVFERR